MEKFKKIFSTNYKYNATANARVNLIGEHTDYTGGYVLPMLLKYKTEIFISKSKNKNIAHSIHYDETVSFDNFIKSKNNHWSDYIKGCISVIKTYNNLPDDSFNILINSNIPQNRGISSSSALCVSMLKALNKMYALKINNENIAKLARRVERDYINVKGGIMDQMISSVGIFGKAFFLDCRTLKFELIKIPKNYIFCLVDSKIQRNLRESSYNKRYKELKEAEKIFKIKFLADATMEDLSKVIFNDLKIKKRAKHVISENDRVLKAKNALKNGEMQYFGKLMNESHESYDLNFEASNDDVNTIVKNSLNSGAIGARLTGGGFGGFTVSLIEKNKFNLWKSLMLKYYSEDKFLS